MSCLTAVVILFTELPNGYRVAICKAVDELQRGELPVKLAYLKLNFSRCELLESQEEAWTEAARLFDEAAKLGYSPIEDGLQFVRLNRFFEVQPVESHIAALRSVRVSSELPDISDLCEDPCCNHPGY